MTTSLTVWHPRALFGGRLGSGDLVRQIYLDEAAKDTPAPVTVVAAIIARPDEHWRTLERRLHEVRVKHMSDDEWAQLGRHFHASKLFNGGKLDKTHQWPPQRRHAILTDLLSIIREENVPVAIGYMHRDETKYPDKMTAQTAATWDHILAFSQCVNCADKYLRQLQPPETATIVAEMMKEKLIKRYLSGALDFGRSAGAIETMKVTQIRDALTFQDKAGSPLLQLADLCAYIAGRYFLRKTDVVPMVKALTGKEAPWPINKKSGQFLVIQGGHHLHLAM